MTFGNPQFASLFVLLAALILFALLAGRKRNRALESFAQRELLKELLLSVDGGRRWIKAGMVFLAFAFCILALMRPQGGLADEEERNRGLDIIFAVDTSKSMLAEDVKPNRLALSKTVAANLLKKMRGDRVGLVAFAGNAFLICPLTVDYGAFLLALDSLDVNAVSRGGTSLEGAIGEAAKGFKNVESKNGVLVMITDGEDHEGDPVAAAVAAKNEGMTIFAMGVGTREGELVAAADASGNRSFLKDRRGNVVKSGLDETLLNRMASATGGSYLPITDLNYDVHDLYSDWFSKREKREFEEGAKKRQREWFQVPLAIALLLLIGEPFIAEGRKEGTKDR